jgi:hypothetical protein
LLGPLPAPTRFNICQDQPIYDARYADRLQRDSLPPSRRSWLSAGLLRQYGLFPGYVETGSGWFYVPTGNLFTREQVQPSQDHHCHVCLGRGGDHRSICAFIAPNA